MLIIKFTTAVLCTLLSTFLNDVHSRNGYPNPQYDLRASSNGGGYCGPDEATCRNGDCVKRDSICDGEYDCRDRSDEADCGPLRQCEPNEFQCANRHCVQKMWVCDKEDDCGDNSDEQNCGTPGPGQLCGPSDFACSNNQQCVPRSYQCDGQNDCQDGSDEHGCSDPVVVQPPEPQVSGCLGGTITITCRAVGVPPPFITWRLNWGPVCDPPRCTQTSENGYGVLTITQLIDRDQGAYTCEALNSRKRLLAVPDAILTVKKCGGESDSIPDCDPVGTQTVQPGGRCQCKPYVKGPRCDQCDAYCYFLSRQNPYGCIRCFCMGVTRDCRSSNHYRTHEALTFRGDDQGVTVSDFGERGIVQPVDIDYSSMPNGLTVRPQEPSSSSVLYWRMPVRFLGNKLTSYGGFLKFVIKYDGYGPEVQNPLVVLKGNEINLIYRQRQGLAAGVEHSITIPIYETSFTREDGQPATHEHLLMTLAGLESLLIRQTHCQSTYSSSLGEVVLDIAVPERLSPNIAYSVEQCSCPEGYKGLSCEECAPGFQRSGGGLYLGTCVRQEEEDQDALPTTTTTSRPNHDGFCHSDGSVSLRPDPRTHNCYCKDYVIGQRCERCKPNSYYLSANNPHGCINCFCSGVTRQCESSTLYRQEQTVADFRDWVGFLRYPDFADFKTLATPAMPDESGALVFNAFHESVNGQALYLPLKESFLHNQISSYGGKIRLRFNYTADGLIEDQNPCLILRGNNIALYHTTRERTQPLQANTIVIPLFETYFQRHDKHPASREHFLMTLADLDEIWVKVTWKQGMRSFSLLEVTMDYASHVPSPFGIASTVEQCRCPEGYLGSSCENCASGFSRTGGGLYLGLCEPCFCNGHSAKCQAETGYCEECQHNTIGAQCESCASGYTGDATRGTPYDCQWTPGVEGGSPTPESAVSPVDENSILPGEENEEGEPSETDYPHDLDNKPDRGDLPEITPETDTCPSCECHNHSPQGCDARTCQCIECMDNTEGDQCEKCRVGFYGDATEGTPFSCQQCPCPPGVSCGKSAQNYLACHCPDGYIGSYCAECALGYTQDPENPGKCIPETWLRYQKIRKARQSQKLSEMVKRN